MDVALLGKVEDGVVAQIRLQHGNQTGVVDQLDQMLVEQFFAQLIREDRLEDVEEIDHVFFVQLLNLENLIGFPLAVRRARAEARAFGPEVGIARGRVRMDAVTVVDRVQLLDRRLDVLDVVVVVLLVVVVQHRLDVRRRRGEGKRSTRRCAQWMGVFLFPVRMTGDRRETGEQQKENTGVQDLVQQIIGRVFQENGQGLEGQFRQLTHVEVILLLLELVLSFVDDRLLLAEHQTNDAAGQGAVLQHRSRVVRQTEEDREGDEHVVRHGHRVRRRRGDQRREIEEVNAIEDVAAGQRRGGETFVVRLNRRVITSEVLSEDLQAIGVNERIEQGRVVSVGNQRAMGDQFLLLEGNNG